MAQRGGASVLAPTLAPPPSFADVKGGASSTAPSAKLATYEITMPDGAVYHVDAPEDVSESDIMSQVTAQHTAQRNAPTLRQQQLNYPTQTELGKEPGRATSSTGILDSIGQGLSSGWEDIKSLPASILGLNDPDSLTSTIARGLSGKGPRDLKAELVAAQEQAKARTAKQGVEAGLDKTAPYTVNPNTLHTAVNVAGALPGLTPVTPTLPVQGSLPIAHTINSAIEQGPAQAGTEAAMAVVGPLLGIKAGTTLAGPISRGLTALGEESGLRMPPSLNARFNPATNLGTPSISALSTMIDAGVKNEVVNKVASQIQPIWQQAASEMGVNTAKFTGDFPARAFTALGRENLIGGIQKALEVADRAVEISDRPFKEVLQQLGRAPIERPGVPAHLTVKGQVLGDMERAVNENSNNPALVHSIKELAKRVEQAKDFDDLQDLKALSNKNGTPTFDAATGRRIDMSADPAQSWIIMGNAIRAAMYPELSRLSGIDLSTAGQLERAVMDGRDGIQLHAYNTVLPAHNQRAAMNWYQYVKSGNLHQRQMWARAMFLNPTPAGQFNTAFKKGLGPVPESPNVVPYYPSRQYVPAPPSMTPEMLAEVHRQQLARQAGVEGIAFPYPPRSAPFSQAPTPPSTQSGAPAIPAAQTPPAFGSTAVRDASVRASLGLPAEPIHPRIARPVTETHGVGGSEPYLYGEQPTRPYMDPNSGTPIRFNPIQRDTYTTQDLMGMMMEINSFIRDFPSHPEVAALKQDLAAVQHEITRRMEARRAGPRL